MNENILGVKIDYITIDQAVETVEKWLQRKGKHYIVTPNPEMIVDSQFDIEFKSALNEADLAIPDSSRLGWANKLLESKNPFLRLTLLPFFLFPKLLPGAKYPTITGTDLMERLIAKSEEKGFTTAYLGGKNRVAVKLYKCLRKKYPKLKIVFSSGEISVDEAGNTDFKNERHGINDIKNIKSNQLVREKFNLHRITDKIDILFVAFGHKKQEKWMCKNLPKLNARVMVGVGGAFDYLSGEVKRAPQILRSMGLEWVFRLAVQPFRIKRFWKLPYFLYMVITSE